MASVTTPQLPQIDFSELELEKAGTPKWAAAREAVMRALEAYGCFQAVYNKVSTELREAVLGGVARELLGLLLEAKLRSSSDKPNHGYIGQIPGMAYESLAIVDAPTLEGVQRFTDPMWPMGGNPRICIIFDTLFPRIPVAVMRQITANLERLKLSTKHSGVTGECSYHGSDDTARRPLPLKAALSVSFGQRAPHRASTRYSSPVRRTLLPPRERSHSEDLQGSSPSNRRSHSCERSHWD